MDRIANLSINRPINASHGLLDMMPKPIDNAAYSIIVELIDGAEEAAVRLGRCTDEEANSFVTRDFILCAAGIITGATVYLPNDERIGADVFLSRLPKSSRKLASAKRRKACSTLLAERACLFFPLFDDVLRLMLHRNLDSITDPRRLAMDGLVLLASASLPGSVFDIRRRIRMLGGQERLLVTDEDRQLRSGKRHTGLLASL